MSVKPKTVTESIRLGRPEWYTFENSPNGVSHLYADRSTTLCGLSNDPGVASQTAKHCASCTSRLKAFVESALIEYEWVEETVTVSVVRPASGGSQAETVRDKVALALSRKGTWNVQAITSSVTPHMPTEAPGAES